MTDRDPSPRSEARRRPPLDARRLLAGFRDLGSGAEPGERILACDASFNRYSAFWVLGQTLDAAYAATEGMLRASKSRARELFDDEQERILSFLAAHHNPDTGRFITDSSPRTGGVFAYHAAIGLIRNLEGLKPQERLPAKTFDAYIRQIGGDPAITRDALVELVCESRSGDALVENPEVPLFPTLTALYTASLALHYLEDDVDRWPGKREILRFLDGNRVKRFLHGCFKRQQATERVVAGFTIHPEHQELCVNTTSFGLRLQRHLGIPLPVGAAAELESFLMLAYRDGGFSSTLWEPRSLNATYLGLQALRRALSDAGRQDRWQAWVQRERLAIIDFVRSCTNPETGGSPFAPDFERYRENCLATRYRIQILDLIGAKPTAVEQNEAFEFFSRQFDRDTGGFRAYPEDQVDTGGFDTRQLETVLDEKDARLLAYHRDRVETPGLSYRPDTRTIELYDRLGELRARRKESGGDAESVEREIESTRRTLRARQRAGAERFQASFDREVLAPLREGRAELAELRKLLSQQ